MRPHYPLTMFLLATSLLGCKGGESPDKDAPAPAAPELSKGDLKKVDSEAAPSEAEKKEQEEAAQWVEGLKKTEERYAKEKELWTPERQEAAKKALAQDFENLDSALAAVLSAPFRSPENVARDQYRHPKETLAFFGLEPDMTVLEISPGRGWYSEILAPVLAGQGKLVHMTWEENPDDPKQNFFARASALLLESRPELFGQVEKVTNQSTTEVALGEPEAYDMVMVFRMMHNFQSQGIMDTYLQSIHEVLKPGGVLAVVQHRAPADAKPEESAEKGYLPEAWLIETIESKGFKLEAKSEINANPKDTKDYEKGVWTLPPSLALEDKDKEKYLEIGESDRMTLKFVKVDRHAEAAPGEDAPGGKDGAAAPDKEEAAGG